MSLRNAVASTSKLCPNLARSASFYPNSSALPAERPKPPSAFHYTGEPTVQDEIDKLRRLEFNVRRRMIADGLSNRFSADQTDTLSSLGVDQQLSVPGCNWDNAFDMGMKMVCPVNEEQRSRIVEALEKLHGLLGRAALYDRLVESQGLTLTEEIAKALAPFVAGRLDTAQAGDGFGDTKPLATVDKYGRIAARGRAKSARATVWIIKTKRMPSAVPSALEAGATPPDVQTEEELDTFVKEVEAMEGPEETQTEASIPSDVPEPLQMYGLSAEPTIGRVLINNRPMVDVLPEIHARNVVLEPFSLTQTLGDYNVFAIATHGGKSSRARAIAHAIARCLFEVEGATAREVLVNSGLLLTDPRVRLRSMPDMKGNRSPRRRAGRPGKAKRSKR